MNKHSSEGAEKEIAVKLTPSNDSRWPPLGKPKEYGSDAKLHKELFDEAWKYLDFANPAIYHLLACFGKASYLPDKFETAPYLAFIGDVGTGKTEALRFLSRLCHKGYLRDRPSPPSLWRTIDKFHPTILLDNLHMTSQRDEPGIIAVLDSGYKKDIKVDRVVNWRGKDYDILSFDLFGPKAFASNEDFQHRSLASRCITVYMAKRQRMVKHSYDELRFYELRRKCLRYAQVHGKEPVPDWDNKYFKDDRLYEVFSPLLFVADTEAAKRALLEIGCALDNERGPDFEAELRRALATAVYELSGKDGKEPFKMHDVRKLLETFGDTYSSVSDKTIGGTLRDFQCVIQREGSGDRDRYYMLPRERREWLKHRYAIRNSAG